MGRHGVVYPAPLAGERACLNCEEPFTPTPTGWQALYCTLACWRANNGGPRRHHHTAKPARKGLDPLVQVTPVADAMTPEEAIATLEPSAPPAPPAPPEPAPASRLVVIGVTHCPRCDIDDQVYGVEITLTQASAP
jgi:hypothetical protein